jgi:hypothetical protein
MVEVFDDQFDSHLLFEEQTSVAAGDRDKFTEKSVGHVWLIEPEDHGVGRNHRRRPAADRLIGRATRQPAPAGCGRALGGGTVPRGGIASIGLGASFC